MDALRGPSRKSSVRHCAGRTGQFGSLARAFSIYTVSALRGPFCHSEPVNKSSTYPEMSFIVLGPPHLDPQFWLEGTVPAPGELLALLRGSLVSILISSGVSATESASPA